MNNADDDQPVVIGVFYYIGKLANYFVFLRPKTIKNASLQRPSQSYTYPRT